MAAENASNLDPSQPEISPEDLNTRIGLLFVLLVISAISSLIPVLCSLKRKKKGRGAKESAEKSWKAVVLSILNCFAGGVFLGVTFLHLLPDITEDWETILSQVWTSSYPFDYFLVVLGFFLVLIIEQIAYACQRPQKSKKVVQRATPTPTPQIRIQPNIVGSLTASLTLETEATRRLQSGEGNSANCEQCKQEHAHHTQKGVTSDRDTESPNEGQSLLKGTTAQYSSPNSARVQGRGVKGEGDDEGEGEAEEKDDATSPGGLHAMFLGLALSVHSVFEGLAFALIENANDVGPLMLCIAYFLNMCMTSRASCKPTASYSVGVRVDNRLN